MKIVNEPHTVALGAYYDALDKYVERVSRVAGVRTIATMGSIGAPGLSDLDVLVVTEDRPGDRRLKSLSTKGIDDNLFLHGPIVLPISFLPYLQWIVYATNLRVLHGSDSLPSIHDLAREELQGLSVCYLVDFLESRLLQFSSAKAATTINARYWHTRIWSVTHSVHIWQEIIGGELTSVDLGLVRRIRRPRELWLAGKSVDDNTLIEAFVATEQLTTSLFMRVLREFYHSMVRPSRETLIAGSKKFMFMEGLDAPVYHARRLAMGNRRIEAWLCKTPMIYYQHIRNYLPAAGYRIDQEDGSGEELAPIAVKRAKVVTSHQRWLATHAPEAKSMAGYLGLPMKGDGGQNLLSVVSVLIQRGLLIR